VVPRAEHTISRANIHPSALKVLYRLKDAGYAAYLVGGGVRDMLLGREPKDFDIATDARPEEVKAQFRQCRLVGRRFRLAHVGFGRDVVEVATFRALHTGEDEEGEDRVVEEDGRILRDNVYGTIEEDAWRRDFTVNALYYDIRDFSVVDYTGGLTDLREGVLRLIGDPQKRYREDPVRMLRAVRFAVKLGFRMHPDTEGPIPELAHLLESIPAARLFDEVLKLFLGGAAVQTFEALRHYGLFRYLFPLTDAVLAEEAEGFPRTFVVQALANTDARIEQDKPVTPAFLFAALLWEPMRRRAEQLAGPDGAADPMALEDAAQDVVQSQTQSVVFPKRFSLPMREIWLMQPRLARTSGRAPLRLLTHPRFRAAYDFLLLRAQAGEDVAALAQWWTTFQEAGDTERDSLLAPGANKAAKKKKRRRRGRRKPAAADASGAPEVGGADSD
jgi:poly(A) polymerase